MTDVEYAELTPQQKRNVDSLRIKKALIKKKYGNHISIVTTEEEAANNHGPMAIPFTALPDSLMHIQLTNADTNSIVDMPDDGEDVNKLLHNIANKLDPNGIVKTQEKPVFTVPEGYKLVKEEPAMFEIPKGYKLVKEETVKMGVKPFKENIPVGTELGRTKSKEQVSESLTEDDLLFIHDLL